MGITSVLLAGGQNKRMNGIPKWELQVGNETMLERSVNRLKGFSSEILVVTGGEHQFNIDQFKDIKINVVYDHTPYLGPLNGIYTALSHSNNNYNFVIAADMPFFSTDLSQYMYKIATENKAEIVVPVWKGNLQPLHAIYVKKVLPSIKSDLEQRKNSLIKWILNQHRTYFVKEKELEQFNKDGKVFSNMNYPEDYHRVLEWMKEDKSE